MPDYSGPERTILVVGGGFSGTVFALRAAQRPGVRVVLIEREPIAGRGVAYGACDPVHVLNVPVARMEVGLEPGFAEWLSERPEMLVSALEEAEGELSRAFVARASFGAYLAEQLEAKIFRPHTRLVRVRGEAVRVSETPRPAVLLADGRLLEGDVVLLATGNMAPRPPRTPDSWFYDTPAFVPDPWSTSELAGLPEDAPVFFIGAGLTMVDVALRLAARGHRGPMLAVSRHGWMPNVHLPPGFAVPERPAGGDASGGIVLPAQLLKSSGPLAAMCGLRAVIRQAQAAGVPWQKVMDAVRPHLGGIWSHWSTVEQARFLRHGRALWDIHRHRMAPRIAAGLSALLESGQLQVRAGRVSGYRRLTQRDGGEAGVQVSVRPRGGGDVVTFDAAKVVNCTGPRSDFAALGVPLFADLRRTGRLVPDPLGLGIETQSGAVVDRFGQPSRWLFALGPLCRPAWWEITAVPEVSVQIAHLVERLTRPDAGDQDSRSGDVVAARVTPEAAARALLEEFVHLGEGI